MAVFFLKIAHVDLEKQILPILNLAFSQKAA
jgi:hypothetical protein